MSKKRNGKRIPQKDKPFFHVPKPLFNSPQFERLSGSAQLAYLILLSQKERWYQREVTCPYSVAERKMNRHTFARAVRELVKAQFIKIKRFGGLYRYTNIYEFDDGWRKTV